MRCGVPELVEVEAVDAGEPGTASQSLVEAVVPEGVTTLSDPELRLAGAGMVCAFEKVAADRLDGGRADGDGARGRPCRCGW